MTSLFRKFDNSAITRYDHILNLSALSGSVLYLPYVILDIVLPNYAYWTFLTQVVCQVVGHIITIRFYSRNFLL